MKDKIKSAAIELAEEKGLENISRSTLCAKANVPPGSFKHITGVTFKAYIRGLVKEGYGGDASTVITKRRVDPAFRRGNILSKAIELIQDKGVKDFTRGGVASAANVSENTIARYYKTMTQLKRAVLRKAKKDGNTVVVQRLSQG